MNNLHVHQANRERDVSLPSADYLAVDASPDARLIALAAAASLV
jgi:hypothetical protein